jgi:hypothetical protein
VPVQLRDKERRAHVIDHRPDAQQRDGQRHQQFDARARETETVDETFDHARHARRAIAGRKRKREWRAQRIKRSGKRTGRALPDNHRGKREQHHRRDKERQHELQHRV